MFDAFFDGSETTTAGDETWLVLGAVSGRRDTCERVRDHWQNLLERFGVASLHMREAGGLTESIGRERFDALVQGAIGVLTQATFDRPQRRLLATFHALRMDHFREIVRWDSTVRTLPQELLALHSLNDVYQWHRAFGRWENVGAASGLAPAIRLVFDRGEGFRGHLVSDWSNKLHRRHHRRWELIEAIDEASARDELMLQAADLLAWSARRRLAMGPADWRDRLARDVFETPKIPIKRIFQGEELRVATRALSGQGDRYRKAPRIGGKRSRLALLPPVE